MIASRSSATPTSARVRRSHCHRGAVSPVSRTAPLEGGNGVVPERPSSRAVFERARGAVLGAGLAAVLTLGGGGAAEARLEGVNKPELLPKEYTPVIDVAGFLTDGEEARLRARVENLEKDTGVKLRVLAQNYPETPGLAIKEFWGVDDDTVVFVADPNTGNILNFNVGANLDLLVPNNFWSRLAGKFGNKFFWREKGESAAIENAVFAIDTCFREPIGRGQCSRIFGIED